MISASRKLKTTALLACGVLLCSCNRREDVTSYTAPKHTPVQGPVTPPPPPPRDGMMQSQRVVWTVPQGWREAGAAQGARAATYKANDVEVAVTSFPGDVGGLLANVNRWRGQIGLSEVDENGLSQCARTIQGSSSEVTIVTLDGTESRRLLGAIIDVGDGKTWFVKAIGPREQIEALGTDVESLAQSFRIERNVEGWSPDPTRSSVLARLASWNAPANWTKESDPAGISVASYRTRAGGEGARVTLTSLKSDGGGELSNINRWRGQLGLAPVNSLDEQPSTQLTGARGAARVVDLASASGDDRMICIMVPEDGATWFFKIRGTGAGVEGVRESFLAFARSVGLGE